MATKAERARYEAEREHAPAKKSAKKTASKKTSARKTHAQAKKSERGRKDAPALGRSELVQNAPTNRYRQSSTAKPRPRGSR